MKSASILSDWFQWVLVACLAILFLPSHPQAQVRIYRTLPEIAASSRYLVEVRQGTGSWQVSPTYQITPNATGTVTINDHFSSFGFSPAGGPAQVRITLKSGVALTASNSSLVNKRYTDVQTSHSNGAMILAVADVKRHLYVKVQGQDGHPLMIFVDPLNDSPIPANAKVVTFAASSQAYEQTAQYDRYTIAKDVDAVVIEDGALIKGTIHAASGRTKPLLVTGRGMVLGRGAVIHGPTGIPYNALVATQGKKNRVENVMVVNSRHFGIDVGDSAVLDNAKMYGYDTNNDGVVGGDGSQILNVFLKVNDDHVKLYNDGMVVRGASFWGQTNGGILQFGWFGQGGADNILVEDSEVIAYEIGYCGDPALGQGGIARSFMSIQNQDQNTNSRSNNVLIRNIIIQGKLKRLVGLNGNYLNSHPIEFTNTRLENITLVNKPDQQSWIYTRDGSLPYSVNLVLKNVKQAGVCIGANDFKKEGTVNITLECPVTGSSSSSVASSSSAVSSSSSIVSSSSVRPSSSSVASSSSVRPSSSSVASSSSVRPSSSSVASSSSVRPSSSSAASSSSVQETGPVVRLLVYPNPVRDQGDLYYTLLSPVPSLLIQVYDARGMKVRDFTEQNARVGENRTWIKDCHQLGVGNYMVQVLLNGRVVSSAVFSKQ